MNLKTLVIADRPPKSPIKEIIEREANDLIITLGDLEYSQISALEFVTEIPKIGVYGNHCTPGYLELLGITNLHLKTIVINGITFGGFEGSHRYKKDEFAKMYTQEDAMALMKDFSTVDVFIAHSPPAGVNDEEDPAHIGLIALKVYLDDKHPKYFFHGHTYPSEDTIVKKYKDTEIIYVTAEKVVDLVF
jgi:Icc-related predicted phosphoesterase